MNIICLKQIFLLILLSIIISPTKVLGQNKTRTQINGFLTLDESWDSTIFLSYIPTYDEMYSMSNEMIIAKTGIDSLGYFKFDIDFLPEEKKIYRLHVIKKGDTPATLIIGGKDENHLFLILDGFSKVELKNNSSYPPFKNIYFRNSIENKAFQHITNLVYHADSIAAVSGASKRLLVENQLHKDLLSIADTSDNLLVSLYAVYKSNFRSNYSTNKDFYKSYSKRWKNKNNVYINSFSEQLPAGNNNTNLAIGVVLVLSFSVTGFFLGKSSFIRNRKLQKLSVQERKIYELLQKGATNKEISDHFNIGVSTVKSHVSSIYSKLKVKSRKEILKRE